MQGFPHKTKTLNRAKKKNKKVIFMKSPKMSFQGWSFLTWLKGNWKSVKEIIKIGVPLLLGTAMFKDNPALIGVTTAVGKLVLDSLEYYFKEYP